MIERNRNAGGRLGTVLFGLANIVDGLVRVLSFGFLHTRLPLTLAKWQAKMGIKRLKRKAGIKV
jgi:hypothetical protein